MGTEPDDEWLMMDASHVTVHPHASGAKGETKIGPAQKGAPFQEPLAVDTNGLPVRMMIKLPEQIVHRLTP